MINTVIGKYKILRLIGEGGMASVYEAEHEMLGTKVALKVLNPILSANAQIRERFKNEAKLMASLNHPNITKVIDFDDQPQQLSIVLEFLEGEDLDDKIKREGGLSDPQFKEIFNQTLSAFQYAHEKGIVHRDIKPSNIFILPNGQVKVLDFGIAKLFGQGNEMTQTGAQMGTPIYMSPEQVKGDKSIDHRSDIYSLGVTMFFAVNGIAPYSSDTDSQFDIFTKIVHEPLPEFSIQTNFKDIILKACQKNREDRYQNCQDIVLIVLEVPKPKEIKTENSEVFKVDLIESKTHKIETLTQSESANSQKEIQISQNSLLYHLLPGILMLFLLTYDYYTWFRGFNYGARRGLVFLNSSLHGDFLFISTFLIFAGFFVFRFRYFKSNNTVYKVQYKRILYLVPGIFLLVFTDYLYDTIEVMVSHDTLGIFPSTFTILPKLSYMPICTLISIFACIIGFVIYFRKGKNNTFEN